MEQDVTNTLWRKFLKQADPHSRTSASGGPIYKLPMCGNCKHWKLIDDEGMTNIQSPDDFNRIDSGLEERVYRSIRLSDGTVEVYSVQLFYGWCKRYPPKPRYNYSIKKSLSLFARLYLKVPQKISDYNFPLLSHENECGEWQASEDIKLIKR